MKKKQTIFFNKAFLVFLCFGLMHGCKNKAEVEIANPVTPDTFTSVQPDFSSENLFRPAEVTAFYEARNYAPAWNKVEVRSALMAALKNADKEGLRFEDYHGKEIQNQLQNENDLNKKERVSLEVLLTDAFLEYAHDLFYGKLDPKKMYKIWGIDRKQIDLVAVLKEAVEKHEVEKALSNLKPQNKLYAGLKKSLQEYKEQIKRQDDLKKISTGDPIKPGKQDARILEIAVRLKQLKFLDQNYVPENNRYDEELQEAVKKFQSQTGLMTDKVLGNSTIQELNMGAEQRYDQILANLERWRWYPRDFGTHYILINIPNYTLKVIKNGETIRTHNVIAGDKTHHTPIFSDSIQYIVLNPEWHIPSSIRDAEIIPSASSDPDYLSSRNIYVTDSDGDRVDPSTINWSSGEASNYRFTQGAGPSNSLGKIKIIYPNKYAIYLHDTPAQAIFDQNSRAESHGCVRVEHVIDLAAYLLSDQEKWGLDNINKVISSGKTEKIKVTQPVLVYHLYWTAWRNEDETIFVNDIYELDQEISVALKK